jgi:UDP-N-acetyl-D-mannosaminuronate dehydrogenase
MEAKALHHKTLYDDLLQSSRGANVVPRKEQVAVVGVAAESVALGLLAAAADYQVIGYDVDARLILRLQNRTAPWLDDVAAKLLQTTTARFTDDLRNIEGADIYIIGAMDRWIEGTTDKERGTLSAWLKLIASIMKPGSLILIEKPVNLSESNTEVISTLEAWSCLIAGDDFDIAYVPSRTYEQGNIELLNATSRVVGGYTDLSSLRGRLFYDDVLRAPVRTVGSLREAESF